MGYDIMENGGCITKNSGISREVVRALAKLLPLLEEQGVGMMSSSISGIGRKGWGETVFRA